MDNFKNPWGKNSSEFERWFHSQRVLDSNAIQREIQKYQSLVEDDGYGWLKVRQQLTNEEISISLYTQVEYLGMTLDNSRENFIILEWPNVVIHASVAIPPPLISRFRRVDINVQGVITFETANKRLKYGNSEWIKAASDFSNPVPLGEHYLWLPDYPHAGGLSYIQTTKYAQCWFRIGDEISDRYLHVGTYSNGCLTLGASDAGGTDDDRAKWTDLYSYLIRRRTFEYDDSCCGKLIVKP